MTKRRVKVRFVSDWPLACGASALLVGLVVGSLLSPESASLLLLLAALSAVFGFGLALVRATAWLALPILMLVGIMAAGSVLLRAARQPLVTTQQTVEGLAVTVVSAPVERERFTQAYVDLADDRRLRAEWPAGESVRYGDQLVVSGMITPPEVTPEFDEARFLRAHGARGTLNATSVEQLTTRGGNPVLRALHDLRLFLLDRLDRALGSPANAVVAGIVFGEQSRLAPALVEAFRRTGTSHLLVASGSNLIIFAAIVAHLAAPLGRWRRIWLTLLVLAAFVVLAGFESSIVRAAGFASLGALAELTGRRIHWPTLIAAVAAVMALQNPWIIVGDIGFQLSFAAVLGLGLFESVLAARLPGAFLKEFLAPTLAAQLTTLPILIVHFGQASLIAPLANLLAVPFALPLMAGGLATAILPALRVIAWATEGAATLFLWVVTGLATVPWASTTVSISRVAWVSASLLLIVVALVFRQRWLRLDRLASSRGLHA
ncbi:ComEC/Rec2 family competence protein [Candidatus Berkelbacteria bacterium]|nr:ComEC/Rec2 family competence protein [Candidatus Berkelbacteria bacterium]